MDSILDDKIYDARIRPSSLNSSDGPTNIQVNLMIRSIDKIDDVKMEFSVQITFRLVDLFLVTFYQIDRNVFFLAMFSSTQSRM